MGLAPELIWDDRAPLAAYLRGCGGRGAPAGQRESFCDAVTASTGAGPGYVRPRDVQIGHSLGDRGADPDAALHVVVDDAQIEGIERDLRFADRFQRQRPGFASEFLARARTGQEVVGAFSVCEADAARATPFAGFGVLLAFPGDAIRGRSQCG